MACPHVMIMAHGNIIMISHDHTRTNILQILRTQNAQGDKKSQTWTSKADAGAEGGTCGTHA